MLWSELPAQQKFTSVTVTEWTATDGTPAADGKAKGIVLPGGSQLSRVFATTRVDLKLVSRPVFSAIPADWASLEIGPASLTFVRDTDGGGMVLLGDEPLALPFALPLDAAGRCTNPLEIVFGYDQAQAKAVLTIQEVVFDVSATASTAGIEVAVSAGRKTAWVLDSLQIAISQPDALSSGSVSGLVTLTSAKVLSSDERAAQRQEALTKSRNHFNKNEDAAGEKELTDSNLNPRNTAEWHLESANELIQAAFSIRRAGKPQKAAQLAGRALEHTEKAARKAARQTDQAALASTAESTAAFIHERLLGDYASAQSFYQSAALRQPHGHATDELGRLKRAENEARRKVGETVPADEIAEEPPSLPAAPDDGAVPAGKEGVLQ